jgi:hypothetical protein
MPHMIELDEMVNINSSDDVLGFVKRYCPEFFPQAFHIDIVTKCVAIADKLDSEDALRLYDFISARTPSFEGLDQIETTKDRLHAKLNILSTIVPIDHYIERKQIIHTLECLFYLRGFVAFDELKENTRNRSVKDLLEKIKYYHDNPKSRYWEGNFFGV